MHKNTSLQTLNEHFYKAKRIISYLKNMLLQQKGILREQQRITNVV